MTDLLVKISEWLQSVIVRLPSEYRAVYVEYGDSFTRSMEHVICFNGFGFESLVDGRFDPTNRDHIGELGNFTWEPPDECRFRSDDYPGMNWLAILRSAAESQDVLTMAAARGIQLIIGEHGCEVFIIV